MNLLKSFESFIKKEGLFNLEDRLLVAVSGGVDSVVLCDLCKRAGYTFMIAHCNFNLRAEESARDEEFVKALGENYGVRTLIKKFDTLQYATQNKAGIQEAARELRYAWFNEILKEEASGQAGRDIGALHSPAARHFIVTAHHADDNIETLLMNFFKGTGINGLKAILPKQANIIRPLLFAIKKDLVTYAEENNLSFVEDSSNLADKYTRNFFRNQLIPLVQKVYPQATENMINNLERFKEIEMLYRQSITAHKKKLLEQKGQEIHIPVLKLKKTVPLQTVVYEIIKDFGFTPNQTTEVIGLLQSETGKYMRSGSHKILRNRNWLIIAPENPSLAMNLLIEEGDNGIEFGGGKLKMSLLKGNDHQIPADAGIAMLDADEIKFPLLLRKWKQGDYFYPLGMKKKKKLSRFFIDQKMSLIEKENTWVIEMNKKIIWIVGRRIDERCKITSATKNILRISLD